MVVLIPAAYVRTPAALHGGRGDGLGFGLLEAAELCVYEVSSYVSVQQPHPTSYFGLQHVAAKCIQLVHYIVCCHVVFDAFVLWCSAGMAPPEPVSLNSVASTVFPQLPPLALHMSACQWLRHQQHEQQLQCCIPQPCIDTPV